MDLSKGDMLIFAGEGALGTWTRYFGTRTRAALKMRLRKERAHGDRWASLWIEEPETADAGRPDAKVYARLDDDFAPIERRGLLPEQIETDLASEAARALGRRRVQSDAAQIASRENGRKGGRPLNKR